MKKSLLKFAPIFLLILSLLVVSSRPKISAAPPQPGGNPFLEMLALVPANAAELDGVPRISYMDYRAAEQARPGVLTYESWADWEADQHNQTEGAGLWLANSFRMLSGNGNFAQYFMVLGDMPAVMGFDFFDIDRSLVYSQPPGWGFIYGGDFDAESIAAAHTARNYTATDVNGVTMWCGAVGCDGGFEIDVQNTNPANIFGGDLGREQPFALVPGYILHSGALNRVEEMIATSQEAQPSILTVPAYAALAEAVTQGAGSLIQAQFFSPVDVGFMALENDFAPFLENYGTLPAYELAIIADRQEGADQVAIMALVYADEATATQAAAELTTRLANFARVSTQNPDPVIEEDFINGVTDAPTVYFSEAADRWVALAAVRYPMPDATQYDLTTDEPVAEGEEGAFRQSGFLMRFWIGELNRRSLLPLLIETGLE